MPRLRLFSLAPAISVNRPLESSCIGNLGEPVAPIFLRLFQAEC
jgi:hypothetical protein